MEYDSMRLKLLESFPQWKDIISVLELREDKQAAPCFNDGHAIYLNTRDLRTFSPDIQSYFLARELMHIQFAHHKRGEGLDSYAWDRATNAVVNQMLQADGFELPDNAVLPPDELKNMSAEGLYTLIVGEKPVEKEEKKEDKDDKKQEPVIKGRSADKEQGARERDIDDPGLAQAVAGLGDLIEPSTQLDYDWFPGDTIRDGMIRERFKPYPVPHAEILLDTSASVDANLLRAFVKGVKALLRDDAVVRVGCFDTAFYGFQEIRTEQDIDKLELRGAGGTDFKVAINAFTGDAETQIIFTDGYAEMPTERCDAIWLIYSDMPVHPVGGRAIYVRKPEEKETHEIDFLIT